MNLEPTQIFAPFWRSGKTSRNLRRSFTETLGDTFLLHLLRAENGPKPKCRNVYV